MFVTNKRVAKKNRRQKVLLFLNFFQPGHKFSGRSDKLLAAGAKGLKWAYRTSSRNCYITLLESLNGPKENSTQKTYWYVPGTEIM